MRVAVTGSHGLVARHLIPELTARGDEVVQLVRDEPSRAGGGVSSARWDPVAGTVQPGALDGCDAVVHLAGVGIAARRWNAAHKQAVIDSRVGPTGLLARTVAAMTQPPRVVLSASAIGYYGDRDDELLTEESPSGSGYLADVCRQWEAAAAPVADAGVRLVTLRTGIIQAADGGALKAQLPLFKLGGGARLGRGRQWVSWISIDDEVGAILHAIDSDVVQGPVNLTAPMPVTNAEYTSTLGRVLHRPALLAVPPVVLKALLGAEMASEMLLASQRVRPGVLEHTGYVWRRPQLEPALAAVVGR